MLRRLARILCATLLLLLLAAAVFFQFRMFEFRRAHASTVLGPAGVQLVYHENFDLWTRYLHRPLMIPNYLLLPPSWFPNGRGGELFLPWWLLFAASVSLTAAVWFLTRRRASMRRSFPIEPPFPHNPQPSTLYPQTLQTFEPSSPPHAPSLPAIARSIPGGT